MLFGIDFVPNFVQISYPGFQLRTNFVQILYQIPGTSRSVCLLQRPKGVLAGFGILIHPHRDKFFIKWVGINAPELPRARFCTEFRAGSF